MKKVLMIALLMGSTNISSAQAGFTVDVNGETPAEITPKLTVNRLASADAIQATDGVPDIFTPLGLSGDIHFGYKNGSFNTSTNIQPSYSLEAIFNNMLTACGGGVTPPFMPMDRSSPMVGSAPMNGVDFILAQSEIENTPQWVLSLQSQRVGVSLFMDASQLTGYDNTVIFNNGMVMPTSPSTQISKTITANIFPTVSNKTVTSKFTIEGLPTPMESSINSFTLGNGSLTFMFKSAVSSNS